MKNLAQKKSSASLVSKLCKALPKALGGITFSLLALTAATASAEPMKVQGRQLLDSCGNPFVVRGVEQILGRELPPGNDWLGVIDEISASGANAVRIVAGVNTLTVDDVDDVLTLIGSRDMVAFLDPLNGGQAWLARADVKAMLAKHESYLILDAYGEPQLDDRERFRRESKEALRAVRALGYRVPLTVTANQFGRDLPSILQFGREILDADPLGNAFLGWQAYWGTNGYYQQHYGLSLTQAIDAIVASGLPIQMGLDRVTDPPSTIADFGTLMTGAQANGIGWLWWDWYNPYGNENNLSQDGTAARLTATGNTVVNTHAASIARTSRLSCSEPTQPAARVVSINAGGEAADAFGADSSFSGGNTAPRRSVAVDRSSVAGAAPEAVYQTERWGTMSYTVGGFAPGSQHSVKLHFAEVWLTSAGQRRFNVNINGQRVLTNYDIIAAAGAARRAKVETFTATANASGRIVIDFARGAADEPKISGIVVQ